MRDKTIASGSAAVASGDPGLIGMSLMHDLEPDDAGASWHAQGMEALRCLQEAGDLQAVAGRFSDLSHSCLVAGDVDGALEYAREAVRVTAEIVGTVDYEGNLAVCALLHGDLEEAEQAARTSIVASCRRGGAMGFLNFPLWVLACCATGRGQADRAARLTAAHDALDAHLTEISSHSFTWTPAEKQARDENRRRLRDLLGEKGFEHAYRQGQAMSLEAAIDLALGRTAIQ